MPRVRLLHRLDAKPESEFSPSEYREALLEQYRTYYERLSEDRRRSDNSTKFFISFSTLLATGYLYILEGKIDIEKYDIIILLFPSLMICLLWHFLFKSWDQMGKVQYEVIEEIEEHLPLQPFTYEWYCKLDGGRRYSKRSWIRRSLPAIMASFFIVVSVYIFHRKSLENTNLISVTNEAKAASGDSNQSVEAAPVSPPHSSP